MPVAASAIVHPTAVIDPRADIGEGVQVGPYVVIDGPVRVGPECILRSHACLLGHLTLGRSNDVGIGVVLGDRPQHLGYKDEPTRTEIGDENIFREHVTVQRGMAPDGATVIGNKNFFMVNVHVAHDCRIGNQTIMANGLLLAGHCTIEDQAFLSGNSGIHQFSRVGRLALLSGLSVLTKDLPPFMLAFERDRVVGVNKIGMRRAGMNVGQIRVATQAFQLLYRSGLMQKLAVQKLEQELGDHPVAAEIITFVRSSKRGFVGPYHGGDTELPEAA